MKRWERYVDRMVGNSEGPWVKYDDAVAAVAAAEQIAFTAGQEKEREMSAPGVALAVAAAENLAYERGVKAGYTAREDAVAVVSCLRAALAAIDALEIKGDSE
jgi:hypothetical protein